MIALGSVKVESNLITALPSSKLISQELTPCVSAKALEMVATHPFSHIIPSILRLVSALAIKTLASASKAPFINLVIFCSFGIRAT